MSDDCTACGGTGRVPSDEAYMMMRAVPCGACDGTGATITIDKKQKAPEPEPRGGGDDE